jgi:cleavage and polyadenylation specificity factor subunit 2
MCNKVPLQGVELDEYLQKERAAKEKEAAQQASMARNQRILEADEGDSESESDSDSDEDEDEVNQALVGGDMSVDGEEPKRGGGKRKRKSEDDMDGGDWGDGDEGLTKQLLSYDIYLKGKVSKSTSFFKSMGGQAQRFRMFPHIDKRRRVDEYGETIDVGMWLRKGKALEEEAEKEEKEEKPAEEDEVSNASRLMYLDLTASPRNSRSHRPSISKQRSKFNWLAGYFSSTWKV